MKKPGGFTLIELILALSLATLVLIALFNLMTPMATAEVAAMQSQTAQINLAGAVSVLERELRQATYLAAPAPGGTGAALEGCSNAAVVPGNATPSAIDASQPMRWFAFCSDGSRLYYHAGLNACPPSYKCGVTPTAAFGGGSASAAAASFTRPSTLTAVVQTSLSITSGGQTASAQDAVAFSAAAGSNQ